MIRVIITDNQGEESNRKIIGNTSEQIIEFLKSELQKYEENYHKITIIKEP